MKKSKLLALILAGCIAVSSLTACGAASGTSAGGRARGSRMTRRGPFGATDAPGDPCRGQPAALTRTVSHAGATPAGPSAEYQICYTSISSFHRKGFRRSVHLALPDTVHLPQWAFQR